MDERAFFNTVREKPFGGSLSQDAVDDIKAIVTAFGIYGDGDERKLAYILGTAFLESDRFKAMEEYASGKAYEGRRDLGNTQHGDGVRFKGRGFVMITGRANYRDWGNRLGIDLLKEPQIVCRRDIAARILVQGMMLGTFTGKKLSDYIGRATADYRNARRIVNGTDKAALIAGYAVAFEAALTAAGYGQTPETPIRTIDPSPEPEAPPVPAGTGKAVAGVTILGAIAAALYSAWDWIGGLFQ
ncbi:hypothetical protein [Aurantimonas sp. A3-2-R12]|uniref:hypothetical protein n=1 Tax=Aurantimonas sp. A3-2-R12 TaxID=3114362 RepID=UPI002E16D63C|nr:hypothetical protein [Aurantimonas sp. A3-2-R12]